MSIATSIEKLSETLTNCKANLKEKEVADVDNIKISDVDEKIAEIQAGGGSAGFKWIKNVKLNNEPIEDSGFYNNLYMSDEVEYKLEFTPNEDDLFINKSGNITIVPDVSDNKLIKETEYTATGSSRSEDFCVAIFKGSENNTFYKYVDQIDSIIEFVN